MTTTDGPTPISGDMRTYWNGEPTAARKVVVRVGTVPRPTWWCAGMEGTERDAVEVTYGGRVFFLDNQDDHDGWSTVTDGHGSPSQSWSLPDDSTVVGGAS